MSIGNTSPPDPVIGQRLAEELGELQQFCKALDTERGVLEKGQADKLPALVQETSRLATRLGHLLSEREQALTQMGFESGRRGMEAWLAQRPHDAGVQAAWQQLLSLAEEARRLQALNGKLIAVQLQHTQQALAALMSASGRPITYGPDGQQRVGGGGRALGSA